MTDSRTSREPETSGSRGGPALVTGATGYVGGRLVPLLLERGVTVRAAVRSPEKLSGKAWASHPGLEIVRADLLDPESLSAALSGCRAAFYLVHSMNPATADFAATDLRAARIFAECAAAAKLERIIYLGGLGEENAELSHHLRSRLQVAQALAQGPVPLTVLRAGVILGSGGASFEIVRHLVERLPVMITPRWVRTRCQPIAIRNVLEYLAGCLDHPETAGQTYDIGGPDVLTYQELMNIYAQEAGLPKRLILPVPFLSPGLSKIWVRLVTPVSPALIDPLVDGLRNEVVCKDQRIRDIIPQRLLSCRESCRAALQTLAQGLTPTCWADAGSFAPPEWLTSGDVPYAGGELLSMGFRATCDLAPQTLWSALESIGGREGWYFADMLWKIRGLADRVMGGVGLGPGRRDQTRLSPGDPLDCWRVLTADAPRRLCLLARMKTPGEAALDFELAPTGQGGTELRLTAWFKPRGLWGLVYWRALSPVHAPLFRGLIKRLVQKAGGRLVEGPLRVRTPKRPDPCRNARP